jgi:hypothetical protein
MFAGSILDLEPDTEYECKFIMSDPDGVRGQAQKTVTVRTRAEPQPFEGGNVYHVYPHGFTGPKIEPSFEGLMCAYNLTCSGTDWATAGRPRVVAGDIILVHAGLYKYNRYEYTNNASVNRSTPYDGTYYLTGTGTPKKPIVIKAAGDGEVIFDGNYNFTLFDVTAGDYHYFEGLTIRNTGYGIRAGIQFLRGCKGLTVKNCRFEDVGNGIWTNNSRSSNFYIADNYFIGRNDPNHLIGWSGTFWQQFNGVDGQVFPPIMASYLAVKVYGPGHVMAYNYVANFHDGIDVETYGNPDGSSAANGPYYPPKKYWDRRPVAIDYYNNFMTNFHDNPFEADGSMHNIRIMRNLMLNSASHAWRNQPVIGGPAYWIRNIGYHMPGSGSIGILGGSSGHLFFHNNFLAEASAGTGSNSHYLNNLFLGENVYPYIFSNSTYTNYDTSDYNGFRPNPGAAISFRWISPPFDVLADYPAPGYTPTRETREYATLAEYQLGTGQDEHSILVDYDIFINVPQLDRNDLANVQNIYTGEGLDFQLKPNSVAVDKGCFIPNVNEDFTGAAPDLGALEVGQPVPHFGPRPFVQPPVPPYPVPRPNQPY